MENTIKTYRDLIVWQRSTQLAIVLIRAMENLEGKRPFGLIDQMCRAAVSIPSNIAEGRQRASRKDFVRFLRISYGSAAELATQLHIAKHVPSMQKCDFETMEQLLTETLKMLNSMIVKLQKAPNKAL